MIKRALAGSASVRVIGNSPTLGVDLPAWCRANGHAFTGGVIARSPHDRWRGAERAETDRDLGRSSACVLGTRGAWRARRGRCDHARSTTRRQARRLGRRSRAPLRASRRDAMGSGDRHPVGRARRPSARGRGRDRPGHDLLDRERDRGAARARALPRPAAPALPRGDAAARDPGGRRGAPHRGLHAPRAATPHVARPLHRGWPGVARDPVRRARLRSRELPALRPRRRQLPRAPLVHPRSRARRMHA